MSCMRPTCERVLRSLASHRSHARVQLKTIFAECKFCERSERIYISLQDTKVLHKKERLLNKENTQKLMEVIKMGKDKMKGKGCC